MLVSGIQQSDSVIHIHVSIPFQVLSKQHSEVGRGVLTNQWKDLRCSGLGGTGEGDGKGVHIIKDTIALLF